MRTLLLLAPLVMIAMATSGAVAGCAATPPPPPASATPTAVPPAATVPAMPVSSDPSLSVLLRPSASPTPLVHVEIDLVAPEAPLDAWRLDAGSPERIANAKARDSRGSLSVQAKARADGPAIDLAFDRAATGPVHLEYDVLATGDAPDDAGPGLRVVVADAQFRAAGERVIALPDSIGEQMFPISLTIDSALLHGVRVASSLGLGSPRQRKARARALRYAVFVGGALGEATFDAAEGHDEAAWLGAPSFDVRGAFTELAELRTFLAEILEARDLLPGPPETYLIDASAARPEGAFVVTPRFESVFLQIGSEEPWGVPVRLAVGQLLARRWIGDAIRFEGAPGSRPAELDWFDDGVARYQAMRLLALGKFLSPDQWAATIAGELSTLATSPYAHATNAELAAAAEKDPHARTAIMVRGALYAARESAAITAHSKGTFSIEHALVDLLRQARATPGRALPASAWVDTIAKDDPDAARTFDAIVVHGGSISLPAGALGACFRAGVGDYVAFDPGFDVDATRAAKDAKVVGLRAGSPAAKAGLAEGDIVGSIHLRDGDPAVPVDLEIVRAGKTLNLSYSPAGARARAQTWTRVKGVPDERCGPPP